MVVAIKVSQNTREKLGLVILIVCTLLACCGIFVIGLAIYMQIHINNELILLESFNSGMLPHFLISVGTLMILLNVISAKIGYDSGFSNTSEKFRMALVPLLVILALFSIVVMSAGIVCLTHRATIEEALHDGLKDAMKRYKDNINVKVAIDKLQMKSRCCGSRSYMDWFNIAWINTDFVNTKSPKVKTRMKNGELYVDSVPFSCCSVHARRPCAVHHIAEKLLNNQFDEKTLYGTGCTETLMDELANKVLYPAGCLVMILFGIQALVTVFLRYLQTSVQHAYEEGDLEGLGTGYCIPNICPAGCCPGDPDKYVKAGAMQASRGEEIPSADDTEESFMSQDESGTVEESSFGQFQEGMDNMDQGQNIQDQGSAEHNRGEKQKREDKNKKKDKKSGKDKKDKKEKKDKKNKKDKSKSDKSPKKSKKGKDKMSKKTKSKRPKTGSPKRRSGGGMRMGKRR